MTSNRRVLAALALGSAVFGILACSSDDRPPGMGSGSSSTGAPGTTSGVTSSSGATSSSSGNVDPDASSSSSSSSGGVDSGPPFQCYDDTSISGDGGTLPTSCPESASCSAHCTSIANHYKQGPAQIAIACLKKLPNCNSENDVQTCVDTATADTCKDSTSATYCTPLVKPCDPNAGQPGSSWDEAGCESFANALNASGRTTFSDCIKAKIAGGNCPNDVALCANEIRL